jgi:hypothetical protein
MHDMVSSIDDAAHRRRIKDIAPHNFEIRVAHDREVLERVPMPVVEHNDLVVFDQTLRQR